jgi:hypothetical protein
MRGRAGARGADNEQPQRPIDDDSSAQMGTSVHEATRYATRPCYDVT